MDEGPAARLYLSPPHLGGEELAYVTEALRSNWIAPLGPMVDAFESEFAQAVGIPHAVALASGTAAIHLGLRCLGVRAGDLVIGSTLTFIGNVTPALYLGALPVLVDACPSSWTMDPDLLEESVRNANRLGKRIGAILPTDLYGQSCDLDAIRDIGDRHGVPVLADSAEALGARYKDRSVGVGAAAAAFSFNGNKIITTSGGGMLASSDSKLIEEARFLSQQARDRAPHYEHSTIGYNYRLSNILAAIGRAQLRVLDHRVRRRREIFDLYRNLLHELPGIGFMPEASYGIGTRWLTVITVDAEIFGSDRETIRRSLDSQGIEARPVWKPMHLQPVLSTAERWGGAVSERLFRDGLCLPSGTQMADEDVARVVNAILAHRRPR